MSLPGNGIFVVRGEMSTLMTAMRRGSRWNSTSFAEEEKDGLMKLFIDLKHMLNRVEDLRLIEPNVFLSPFLEVIRTDETTGAVTSLALAAINKFLSYGLIDPIHPTLAVTVENIVDAVTHARFMGTDQSSDGVTLFRVVEVLHTLMRSPEGNALTNESVCEVMLSCFKICFEPRLNELLRRSAEQALREMVLLLFMRLPQFSEDHIDAGFVKKFQMMAASMEQDKKNRKAVGKHQPGNAFSSQKCTVQRINSIKSEEKNVLGISVDSSDLQTPENLGLLTLNVPSIATTSDAPVGNILDMQGKITQTPLTVASGSENDVPVENMPVTNAPAIAIECTTNEMEEEKKSETNEESPTPMQIPPSDSNEYINSVGVRFTQQQSIDGSETINPLLPYGLPCIQELFRFLILLCNPLDKQNTDTMTHMGLSLLTVAFEVGADNIGKYETLLELVKDDLCRHLILLMNSERMTIFAADLQVCFLLFESLRSHLKFQLEAYLKKLSEIISSDNPKTPYEMRELALDNLLQLWRIPGFIAELYINYDCDLYCTDVYEGLTKLLAKYTLSATNAVYSTHIIAMDTLISVIENIEKNCIAAKALCDTSGNVAPTTSSNRHSRNNSGLEGIVIDSGDDSRSVVENISKFITNSTTRWRWANGNSSEAVFGFSKDHLIQVKNKKRILSQGTELFNQRPDKGIQYLQENGILNENSDPMEIALFLRENPGLDKKMIGEYISKKKNVESKILMNFVDSFDFKGLRIDQALRLYLETFRLPGESPLIFLVLEHFADRWHKQNNEPFANTDAAFSLAYAIIMLNVDQHNSNAKRLNIPMTQEDFARNLRGVNGGSDFDQDMLANIFNSIKNEEIIMPAEQAGIVRENYLWKVLLRRGVGPDNVFSHVQDTAYDKDLFQIVWGALLSALGFMFDKCNDHGYHQTLAGFRKCAAISAHYSLHEDFDALILTLCKFSTLLNVQTDISNFAYNEITQAVIFGQNIKAQSATKTAFGLVHDYGDCLRDSWKNILEIVSQLFRLKLLPKSLMEVEDFCEQNGKALLILEKPNHKSDSGLFSSLYSYLSSEGQRDPTYDEQEYIKIGKKCIKECQLDQMIQETKFVQYESLQELLKSVLSLIKPPTSHKSTGLPYPEDVVVFWMEFLTKIVIQNRDRMLTLWPSVRDQMYQLIMGSAVYGYDYLLNRSIVALLKLAIYLMRNEELCPLVLQSLKMLLILKPNITLRVSKQISIGIYELLKTSAQNIHTELDWQIIFTILECVGAGAVAPEFEDVVSPAVCGKSDGTLSSEEDSVYPDRGYISDSEVTTKPNVQQQIPQPLAFTTSSSTANTPIPSPSAENWILVNKDTEMSTLSRPQSPPSTTAISSLIYPCKLIEHSPFALFKCWDSLAFIVRNVAHITPYNFESCVRCIRTFVEACRDGGLRLRKKYEAGKQSQYINKKKIPKRDPQRRNGDQQNSNEDEDEELIQRYETLSIQLLDLMYTLYTRTAQIFRWWAEEGCAVPQCSALWAQGWCPLLQGIARLAMDRRREVRTYAISCLQQRALLVHDLQTLSGSEWASCFKQVLFPLLNELLPDSASIKNIDNTLLEESRIRMATIMSKVFLHHLTPLIELGAAFNDLWIDVLDYIERFMKVGSDMLSEQMLEILKNMLLVMHSVRVFHNNDGTLHKQLWELTWKRIGEFLPNLKEELFKDEGNCAQLMRQTYDNSQQIVKILPQQQSATGSSTLEDSASKGYSLSSPIQSPQHSNILQPTEEIFNGKHVAIGQQAERNNLLKQQQQQVQQKLSPLFSQSSPQIICPIPVLAKPIEAGIKLQQQLQTTSIDKTNTADVDDQSEDVASKKERKKPAVEAPNLANAYSNSEFSIDLSQITPTPEIFQQEVSEIERHQMILDNASREEEQLYSQYYQNFQESSQLEQQNILSSVSNFDVPTSQLSATMQSFPSVNLQSQPDIYSEYMQNPYNLKELQQPTANEDKLTLNDASEIIKSTANYFSSSIDPSTIPAGSEMLFGQP